MSQAVVLLLVIIQIVLICCCIFVIKKYIGTPLRAVSTFLRACLSLSNAETQRNSNYEAGRLTPAPPSPAQFHQAHPMYLPHTMSPMLPHGMPSVYSPHGMPSIHSPHNISPMFSSQAMPPIYSPHAMPHYQPFSMYQPQQMSQYQQIPSIQFSGPGHPHQMDFHPAYQINSAPLRSTASETSAAECVQPILQPITLIPTIISTETATIPE